MSDSSKYAPFRGLIAKRMDELNLRTVEDFGEKFGINRGTIYTLYSGRISSHGSPVKPSVETLLTLSRALQKPLYELIYLLGPDAIGEENFDDLKTQIASMKIAPELSRILAEIDDPSWPLGTELIDIYPVGWHSDTTERLTGSIVGYTWVPINNWTGYKLSAFKAFGDSMASGKHPIYVGDTLIVEGTNVIESGDLVVIQLESGKNLCRLFREDQYIAANPLKTDPTPIVVTRGEADLLGRVTEVRHSFRANF